eukprot:673892-Alexandrium_andersonii.AAC.1
MNGLRVGDMVDRGDGSAGQHPNTWSLSGLLRVGFSGTGKHGTASGSGVGQTSHTLDALVSVCHIGHRAQAQALTDQLDAALLPCAAPGLTILWHHDATPLLCHFGKLQARVFRDA